MAEKDDPKRNTDSAGASVTKGAELVQGDDYYIENGRYVFTAKYLLKRGVCCESGCRHCPYGFRKG